MSRQPINEDLHIEKQWFEDAREQTLDTLMGFINHVMNDYVHDYGTLCHAVSACAVAAAWAANSSEGARGGITGFQASFVMWDFIRYWLHSHNKCGLMMIDFDNMLYPQYEYRFDKTIPKDVWELLQKQAAEKLKDLDGCSDRVADHWRSIVNGNVPFGYRVVDR